MTATALAVVEPPRPDHDAISSLMLIRRRVEDDVTCGGRRVPEPVAVAQAVEDKIDQVHDHIVLIVRLSEDVYVHLARCLMLLSGAGVALE